MAAKWAYLVLMLALLAVPAFAKDPDGLNFTLLSSSCASPIECSAVLRVCAVNKSFDASRLDADFWNDTSAVATASVIPLNYSWKNKADLKKGECGEFTLVASRPADVASQPNGKLAWGADWRIYYSGSPVHSEWAWWNASWLFKQAVDINTTVTSSLVAFPAKIVLNTTNSTLWNASCLNVRFIDSLEASVLNYELDSGCGTNDTLFWVGVNTTNSSAGFTRIYAYLGNTVAPSGEAVVALWNNATYLSSWHFNSNVSLNDSTGRNNLTNKQSNCVFNATNGVGVGNGVFFNGTCVYGSTSVTLPNGNNDVTVTGWVYNSSMMATENAILDFGCLLSHTAVGQQIDIANARLRVRTNVYGDNAINVTAAPVSGLSFISTRDASGTRYAYYNVSTSNSTATSLAYGGSGMVVGSWHWTGSACSVNTTSYRPQNTTIYELRIRNTSSSVDWITAEYAQTSNTSVISELTAPVMNSSLILPVSAYANSTLLGYCNASDPTNATIRYYYQWFVNDTANASGVTGYLAQGIEQNVANITTGLVKGQNWTLQCIANNGDANSSALNSSVRAILNTPPDTSVPTLSPIPAFITTPTVTCTNGTTGDIDGDAITFSYLWYLNGTTTGITTQGITNASFGGTDVLICQIKANDGTADSIAYNSSALTILGGAPSLSMAAAPGIIYTTNCINATAVFYYTLNDLVGIWGNNTITLVQGGTLAAGVQNNVTANVQHNFTLVLTQGNYTYGMNFTVTNGSTVAGNGTPPNMSFTVADSAAACMAWLINGSGTNVSVNLSEIMENATFRRAIAQDVWRYEQRYKEVYAGANEGLRWQDYLLAVGMAILILFAVVEFITHQRGPRGHF